MKPWLVAAALAFVLAVASGGADATVGNPHRPENRPEQRDPGNHSIALSSQLRQNSFLDAVNDPMIDFDAAKVEQAGAPTPDRVAAPMTVSASKVEHAVVGSSAETVAEPENWATILVGLLGASIIARRRISSL